MSKADWREIYRVYSGEELMVEIDSLKKSLKGGFVSQASGSVNHQKDVGELRDRLAAAVGVLRERSAGRGERTRVAVVDFSQTRTDDF